MQHVTFVVVPKIVESAKEGLMVKDEMIQVNDIDAVREFGEGDKPASKCSIYLKGRESEESESSLRKPKNKRIQINESMVQFCARLKEYGITVIPRK